MNLTCVLSLLLCLSGLAARDEPPTYERDVRPILRQRCTICHSSKNREKLEVSGGLALDSLEAIRQGTRAHVVIVPGRAAASALYRRLIAADDDERMPLGEDALPETEVAVIRRWIEAGLPEGEPSPGTAAGAARPQPPRRAVRALDVTFPTTLRVPANAPGWGPGGPVELVVKVGPLPAATALAFRSDGRLLAVGTVGQVVLWDLGDGRPAAVLDHLPGPVHGLAFSRDGKRLAVGSGQPARSGVARLYTVPDGILIHELSGHADAVYAVAFRPDDAQLATASFDQTVRLWDVVSGQPAGTFTGHSDFVYDVAFSRDGKKVLSASKDRSVKRFDAATAKGLRTYSSHNDDVLALAVRPDGAGFVSAGGEPPLCWWSDDDEQPSKRVGGHSGPVFALAFSANGKRLISASGDRTVRLWDGTTGTFQRSLPGPTDWQYAAALSGDGRIAAAGGWDGIVRIWDADSGTLRATLIQPPPLSASGHDWLIATPAGAFDASEDVAALVRFRIGGQEIPAEVPARVLRQPEAPARALSGQAVSVTIGN